MGGVFAWDLQSCTGIHDRNMGVYTGQEYIIRAILYSWDLYIIWVVRNILHGAYIPVQECSGASVHACGAWTAYELRLRPHRVLHVSSLRRSNLMNTEREMLDCSQFSLVSSLFHRGDTGDTG